MSKRRRGVVTCKTHGTQVLDDPESTGPCPYCRDPMTELVGQGFRDSRGVAYVRTPNGSLRKLDDLKQHQIDEITEKGGTLPDTRFWRQKGKRGP